MFSPEHLRWRCLAALLHCCTLLRVGAQARPFVLLSGWESLPDNDLASGSQTDTGAISYAVKRPLVQALRPPYIPGTVKATGDLGRFSADVPRLRPLKPTSWSAMVPGTGRLEQEVAPLRGAKLPAVPLVSDLDGSGLATASIQKLPSPRYPVKCRDIRQEVVIESGLQGHADVFSGGQTAFSWATSKLVLPKGEQVAAFVVRTGEAASLAQPKLIVSDPSILSVEFLEKQSVDGVETRKDGEPVVFLSKHFCKKWGVTNIAVELPLVKDESARSPSPLCPGTPAPVRFSYQKVCAPPGHPLDAFRKALSADLPTEDRLHALSHSDKDNVPEKPWAGIIPTGGARWLIVCLLILCFLIAAYEFGTHRFSNHIKKMIIEMGPVMFGCEIKIDHCVLSASPRRLSYTIRGLNFKNPQGEWQKDYFMNIEEVHVWFNLYKIIATCGRQIEIRQLIARHITANVEFDGLFPGMSAKNIDKVLQQLDKNNKEWVESLQNIKDKHGIDAAQLWSDFEGWLRKIANRVTLKEVVMEGIGYSVASKAIGVEMKIADMEYHNFTDEHNAVGMPAIAYFLAHRVLEGVATDIGGVELGHGRFEGLVNTFQRWTGTEGKGKPSGQPEEKADDDREERIEGRGSFACC